MVVTWAIIVFQFFQMLQTHLTTCTFSEYEDTDVAACSVAGLLRNIKLDVKSAL